MRPLALVLLPCAASAYAATPARTVVDLDRPGAMDALEQANPEHFRRVSGVIDLASEMPCFTPQFAKLSWAKFDAESAGCGVMLLTSYPAKRQLSFAIEETLYRSTVSIKSTERLVPLLEKANPKARP